MKRVHAMPFGAECLGDGRTRFRLWAPSAPSVALLMDDGNGARTIPMPGQSDGWRELAP